MKIGIAQTYSIKGDIAANINKHKILIELASSSKATSIFFPELSLTAYEPQLANDLATDHNDSRLDCFQYISNSNKITIGLGIPTKTKTGVRISMVIFQPQTPRQTYSKQLLHSDELPYFESGDQQILLTVEDKKISPAICYESLQPEHSDKANKFGAEIYLASVAKSQNGLSKAMAHYPKVAKHYSMPVFMSNSVGYCDNFLSGGCSAVWTKQGQLAGQLDDKEEGILIFDTETEEVTTRTI